MLLLHSDGHDTAILSQDAVIDCLLNLKVRGLVRATGASTKTLKGGIMALQHLDVVMACYNPLYTDEEAVLDYAHEHGGGVMLKKLFASGHLDKLGDNPVQRCFKFAFDKPGVHSAVIGTINPRHLRDNVATLKHVLDN